MGIRNLFLCEVFGDVKQMKKYLTRWQQIESVEVERESDSFVWVGGRRRIKISDYECYHSTGEDAKNYIIQRAQDEVDRISKQLDFAKANLEKAKNAKIPE